MGNWIARRIARRRSRRDAYHERREAIRRAYAEFARRYPCWTHSLFDEHFINHTAHDILTRGLLQPEPLAQAWTHQFYHRPHIREVLPIAEIFIRLIRAEMV